MILMQEIIRRPVTSDLQTTRLVAMEWEEEEEVENTVSVAACTRKVVRFCLLG